MAKKLKNKITLRNPKFLRDIKTSINNIRTEWINLCELLYDVDQKKKFKILGYSNFKQFIVSAVPEIEHKTAIKLLCVAKEYNRKLGVAGSKKLSYSALYALAVSKKDIRLKKDVVQLEKKYFSKRQKVSGNEIIREIKEIKRPKTITVKKSSVFKQQADKLFDQIYDSLDQILIGYSRNNDLSVDLNKLEKIMNRCNAISKKGFNPQKNRRFVFAYNY